MAKHNIRAIFYSFLIIIGIGTFLLLLPVSHNGKLSLIDALFTSTSAVCVTGLIVKNTSVDFTTFGHVIILLLIQIGGLGYMAGATFLAVMLKQRIGYRDRLILKEALYYPSAEGVIKFVIIVFKTVFLIESIGAFLLWVRFSFDMPWDKALWFGIFHAVSAFNNAGFSLFEDNMMGYVHDIPVNLIITSLLITGGLGYMVLLELYHFRKKRLHRISTHTKIVLAMTVFLLLLGMLMLLTLEWNNPKTLGNFSVFDKFLAAFFTSANFRTTGFNSIDLGGLMDSSLFFSTFLMMNGAGPGGTAGGMKVTVFAVIIISVWFTLKEGGEPHLFGRSIPQETINRALVIMMVSTFYVVTSTVLITEIDRLPYLRTLFETISAFTTCGVSTGNGGVLSYSALFSDISKLNIILLMFIGRVGVLAFTIFLIGKMKKSRIKYAEGRIIL